MNLNRYNKIYILDSDQSVIHAIDGTTPGVGIVSGSMSIDEVLCDAELVFGRLTANKLEVQIYGLDEDVHGKDIYVVNEPDGELAQPLFFGTIDSSTTDNRGGFRDIVAYDTVYYYRDVNIASAWNEFWASKTSGEVVTIKELRNSILQMLHLIDAGLELPYIELTLPYTMLAAKYREISVPYTPLDMDEIFPELPNDNLVITKFSDFTQLTLDNFLSMICEVQCCFPKFGRNGCIEFVQLGTETVNIEGLYESASAEFEDYETAPIVGLNIFSTSSELVHQELLPGHENELSPNTYTISGNIALLSMNDDQLTIACQNILNYLKNIQYTPMRLNMIVSNLDYRLGTKIVTSHGSHYITQQTYSGSLLVNQEIVSASAGEYLTREVKSRNDNIITGQRLSSFKQTIDTISSRVEVLEGTSMESIRVEYNQNESSVTPPPKDDANWSKVCPAWDEAKYIWQRTYTKYADGTEFLSDPVCIQGISGHSGNPGISNAVVYLYRRSATPITAIDWTNKLTYTFATHSLDSVPTNWYTTIESGSDPIYVTAATASGSGVTDDIEASEWAPPVLLSKNGTDGINGEDGDDGTDGLNTVSLFLYKRSNVTPSAFSNELNYEFALGKLTGNLDEWSLKLPSGTNPCYVIQATAISANPTVDIPAGSWTAPIVLVQNGASGSNGRNNAIVYLFKRTNDESVTIDWSVPLTYDFSTMKLQNVPTNWYQYVPTGTEPLYVTTASASSLSSTDEIAVKEWTAPALMSKSGANGADGTNGKDGKDGIDGVSISTIQEYYAVSSSNSVAPSTWSTTVPTMTSTNKYLWNYEVISYTSGDPHTTEKRVIGAYGRTGSAGKDGTDGEDGRGIQSVTNYYLATNADSGVTTATTGWTTTIQTISKSAPYLWNYEVISYTDGSTSTTTTPCIIGRFGADGTNGKDGKDGIDGDNGVNGYNTATVFLYKRPSTTVVPDRPSKKLTYTFSTGTLNDTDGWSMAVPEGTNPCYIIQATAISRTDQYEIEPGFWSVPEILVQNGTDGNDGVGVSSIVPEYYLSESMTEQIGGSWTTTPPAWSNNKYIWTRSHITYDNGTDSYTGAVLDNSVNDMGSRYSEVKQTADKISWLIASGDSASNFTMTARAMALSSASLKLATADVSVLSSVQDVPDNEYSFVLGDDGFYGPENLGIRSSRSWCRVQVTAAQSVTLNLKIRHIGEGSSTPYDYGMISKVDTQFTSTSDYRDTGLIAFSFAGQTISTATTYGLTIPAGTHYFDVVYIKDINYDTPNEGLYFQLPDNIIGSSITLQSGETVLNSQNIKFNGMVTFADLEGKGNTVINGDNITTGTIQGIQVITDAYWYDEESTKRYKLAKLDAGGVTWYTESRSSNGAIAESKVTGWISTDRDLEGTETDEFWMSLTTPTGNNIILQSGKNLSLEVEASNTISIGSTHGVVNNVNIGGYQLSNIEIKGSKIDMKADSSSQFYFTNLEIWLKDPTYNYIHRGTAGQVLMSGGTDSGVYWGDVTPASSGASIDVLASSGGWGTIYHNATANSYKAIIVIGRTSSSGSHLSCVIPTALMNSGLKFQMCDESYFMNFNTYANYISCSQRSTTTAQIDYIYGIK